MKLLVFDPFAGISGDMAVAALLDLGLPPEFLRDITAGIGIEGVEVGISRVDRSGISCARVEFRAPEQRRHRHLPDVLGILERAPVDDLARARAADAFRRLAAAEAEVHGVPVERVHFHEVGAVDSILDVLCFAAGVTELGYEVFYTRPVMAGRGWVEIEHGRFPVPAPATLKLLQGIPLQEPALPGECTTPTGAALLATLVQSGDPPPHRVVQSGYGAGRRDPTAYPNCLRLIAAEPLAGEYGQERLYQVQADLDDMAPEYVAAAQQALVDAGALDAVVLSVGMKKGRPGVRLEALVPPDRLDPVLSALFRGTTTIGARFWAVERTGLARREEEVVWRGHRIRQKVVRLPGGEERRKPEYEDVAAAARDLGLTPHEARAAFEAEAQGGPATKPSGTKEHGGGR